jgi:sigma-B regulation protein RsbU (phosphoserine phosphatase)
MIAAVEQSIHEGLHERRRRLVQATEIEPRPQLLDLLQEVDAALARVEEGSFGQCEVCHDPIETDRLLSDPLKRICLECLSPVEADELERDLETAARVQTALLPPRDLIFAGWEIHYSYEPKGPVSGDHLDLIQAPDSEDGLYFLLGDVSGKGVAASLLMSHLHALFRTLIPLGLDLEELVTRANRLFAESTRSSSFATLVAGRLGPTGQLELVNAGHCPPLLVRSGETQVLPSTGLPVGLFAAVELQKHVVELDHDDFLYLYTDGLSEAPGDGGEEYGAQRIGAGLAELRGLPAASTAQRSLDGLRAFRNGLPTADDLTVMVIRRTRSSGPH